MPIELTDEQREIIDTLSNDSLSDSVYLDYIEETGDDELENFDEAYTGQFRNDEDFAQDMADNMGETVATHWPHYCIDWKYAASELMMDYFEVGGHYFRMM